MKKLCLALFVGSICFSSFSFNAIAVPPKPEQTIEQLKQAAEKGNIQAQFQLGETISRVQGFLKILNKLPNGI